MSGSVWEVLPDVGEWSGGPPKMTGSGREALRMSGTGREPSQMSGIGPEVLQYI